MASMSSWGKLGPLTAEQVRILAGLPPGVFGDIVRCVADPLWRLKEDWPCLYAEALAEAREEHWDEDEEDVVESDEFKDFVRREITDSMARFRLSVRSIHAVRAAFQILGRPAPKGIREP